MERTFLALGALSAGLAVAAGAFGAHGLRARVTPELLAVFETGARYQMYHALGLLGRRLGDHAAGRRAARRRRGGSSWRGRCCSRAASTC